jgi:lipoprotein-anchoring transpeptidase ErfK/SrfK
MLPLRTIALAIVIFLPAIAADGGKRRKLDNPLEKINDASNTATLAPGASGVPVIRAQILLDRAHFSPGEIDGRFGPDLEIAVKGYRDRHKLKPSGMVDKELWDLLNADGEDLLTAYTITAQDLRDPLVTIPKDTQEQAKLKRMGYETDAERIAEKFHLSPQLLKDLNPNKKFDKAGEEILVPRLRPSPAARAAKVVVSKSKRTVTAIAPNGTVLAQYPATMGGPHDPLPIGNWRITVVRPNPIFYYNPERFWNAKQDNPKAQLPPGPNNPAGTVWLGLSKPHYGIHGSPEPGTVRRAESYGCIRLTNWDASDLARMVRVGTPAILEE